MEVYLEQSCPKGEVPVYTLIHMEMTTAQVAEVSASHSQQQSHSDRTTLTGS